MLDSQADLREVGLKVPTDRELEVLTGKTVQQLQTAYNTNNFDATLGPHLYNLARRTVEQLSRLINEILDAERTRAVVEPIERLPRARYPAPQQPGPTPRTPPPLGGSQASVKKSKKKSKKKGGSGSGSSPAPSTP